ncbi:MAG: hypothetical protein ABWZ82_07700 [Candidatus Limnocylindrales bacterium]
MTGVADALPATTIRAAVAGAIQALLEHPVPLIAANIAWGAIALTAWLASFVAAPVAIVLAVLLAWPAAALAGVAGRVLRDVDVSLRDALRWPVRRPAVAVLAVLAVLCAVVGVVNIQAALARADLLGVAFATVAAWGLVALGVVASVAWPLVGDPRRDGLGVTGILRLAVMVVLLRTPRIAATCLVVWCFLLVSTVLAAALLTVSVAIAALVLSRVVLPIADALDTGLV